nr:uncharacterized protein LOC109192712 [Ipomoea batatas]
MLLWSANEDEAISESCPTVTADDGVAASDGSEAPNPMGPTVRNPATTTRKVSASGMAPYGSWMLVTRTDRRQQGRLSDQRRGSTTEGQRAQSATAKKRAGATGSKFNPLETEEAQEATNGAVGDRELEAEAGIRDWNADNVGLPRSVSQGRLEGRQRRSNVIANEKQIDNEPNSGRRNPAEVGESSRQSQHSRGSRRAAEEDEHVVNRGEDGGNKLYIVTIQVFKAEKKFHVLSKRNLEFSS